MKRLKFKLEDESLESQHAAGRHNPNSEVVLTLREKRKERIGEVEVEVFRDKEHRYNIGAGTSDDIDVFLVPGSTPEFDLIVILSTNRGLGYAGVEVFRDGKKTGDCFCQSEEQLTDRVGPRGFDLRDYTLARRLLEYCGE